MKICEYVTDNSLKNPWHKFHYVLYEEEQNYTLKDFFDNINNNDREIGNNTAGYQADSISTSGGD